LFASLPFFRSKLNYCRVTWPQNKIFIKNQLTLVFISEFEEYKIMFGIDKGLKRFYWYHFRRCYGSGFTLCGSRASL
jgi:hypothetical protein